MPGARDGQLKVNRGGDSPPWTLLIWDDEAGRFRHNEEIEMRWAGEFVADGHYYFGDVVRAGGSAFVCVVPPVARIDSRVDTFTRADQDEWGTASDGHEWALVGLESPGLDGIVSNAGVARSSESYLALYHVLGGHLGTSDREMLVRWSVTTSVSDTDGAYLILQALSAEALNVTAAINLNGNVSLRFNPSGHDLDAPGAWAGGLASTPYWTRARVEGTVVRVKTWADGDEEPEAWDVEHDSTLSYLPGYVGLGNPDSNPLTATAYDHLEVTALTRAVPFPTAEPGKWELLAGA